LDKQVIAEALSSIRKEMKGRLARKLLPKKEAPDALVVIHKEGEDPGDLPHEESLGEPGPGAEGSDSSLHSAIAKIVSEKKGR
jgi:hypothetical protein